MTSDEAEIPQVVVKGTSNCGIVITAADWINQSVGSIELMAVLDGREDGVRRAKLTLYAEVEEIDPRTSSWNSFTESIKLAQYTVSMECSYSAVFVVLFRFPIFHFFFCKLLKYGCDSCALGGC